MLMSRARLWLLFLVAVVSITSVFGVSLSIGYNQRFFTSWDNTFEVKLSHNGDNFDFIIDLLAGNDGRYPSSHRTYYNGYYFFMKNGGLGFRLGSLTVKGGRYVHKDIVESPYSLFISSQENPAVLLDITYDNGSLIYETRWIRLSKEVPGLFPDRGANYKVYALKLGSIRVGFQDVAVYTGSVFDYEYFLNPLPSFFIQYTNYAGRPFPQGENDNSIMGFFVDWKRNDNYLYAQILVDDFNMNRFLHPDWFQNPDKIAWSLGGNFRTPLGSIGVYHAGATKFTFEPFGKDSENTMYGYVYFPKVEVSYDDTTRILTPEENYVGYMYGENNAAFMATYENRVWGIDLSGNVEFVVSGSLSPANPWHELTDVPSGTHFLDESPLQRKLTATLVLEKKIGCAKLILGTTFGRIFNVLKPVTVSEGEEPILKPSDESETVFKVWLGLRLDFHTPP